MLTEIIHTTIRAMQLALRLRTPLRTLRLKTAYLTVMACMIVCAPFLWLYTASLESRYFAETAAFTVDALRHFLALFPIKVVYIFSGILAAGLNKRFSPLLLPERDNRQSLLKGIPFATWFLLIVFILVEMLLCYGWVDLFRGNASQDSEDLEALITRQMALLLNILKDFFPFMAAGILFRSALSLQTPKSWQKTLICVLTGYSASAVTYGFYGISYFVLDEAFNLGNLSGWIPFIIICVAEIIVYGFALPAFVLLIHCAHTEPEDNFRLDFEKNH